MFADTADIGSLLIRVRSQFSQYDADSKGYYLSAFMPGTILKFSSGKYPGNRVELRLVNLSKVQLWSLEPSLAEAVLKKHPNREVLVDVTVQIVGVRMSSSGPQLEGKVRAYAIYANEMQIAAVQLTD